MSKVVKKFFFYCLKSHEVVVLENKMLFGRKTGADYIFEDAQTSGKHFSIVIRSRKIYIEDHNSTNFTFLNDKPINPRSLYLLSHGDRVRAGNKKFIFLYDDTSNFKIPDTSIKEGDDLSLVLASGHETKCSHTESFEQVIHFSKSDEDETGHLRNNVSKFDKNLDEMTDFDNEMIEKFEDRIDDLQKAMVLFQNEIQKLREEIKVVKSKKKPKAS